MAAPDAAAAAWLATAAKAQNYPWCAIYKGVPGTAGSQRFSSAYLLSAKLRFAFKTAHTKHRPHHIRQLGSTDAVHTSAFASAKAPATSQGWPRAWQHRLLMQVKVAHSGVCLLIVAVAACNPEMCQCG